MWEVREDPPRLDTAGCHREPHIQLYATNSTGATPSFEPWLFGRARRDTAIHGVRWARPLDQGLGDGRARRPPHVSGRGVGRGNRFERPVDAVGSIKPHRSPVNFLVSAIVTDGGAGASAHCTSRPRGAPLTRVGPAARPWRSPRPTVHGTHQGFPVVTLVHRASRESRFAGGRAPLPWGGL